MSDIITVEVDDPQRAIDDALDESTGHTRAQLLQRAIAGGGAFAAGGLAIGGLPGLALGKPSAKQDAAILNFALLLEYLESEFYRQAVANGALSGRRRGVRDDRARPRARAREGAQGRRSAAPRSTSRSSTSADTITNGGEVRRHGDRARGDRRRGLQRPGPPPAAQDPAGGREHRVRRGPPRGVDPLPRGSRPTTTGTMPTRRPPRPSTARCPSGRSRTVSRPPASSRRRRSQ